MHYRCFTLALAGGLSCLGGCDRAGNAAKGDDRSRESTAPPATTPKARDLEAEAQILAAIRDYRSWVRVSDRASWIPLSRVEFAGGVRASRLSEDIAHGRHLFFLYASDAAAYLAPLSQPYRSTAARPPDAPAAWHDSPQAVPAAGASIGIVPQTTPPGSGTTAAPDYAAPIGQIVVKETFYPVEVPPPQVGVAPEGRDRLTQAANIRPAAASDEGFSSAPLPKDRFVARDHAELDGKWYKAGEGAGLFVMLKTGPANAPDTDNGWTYAVVDPSATRVIDHGPIESCITCHAAAPYDRLFVPLTVVRIPPGRDPR